jgi:branched-chain amino acid transport system substrate-binding protein
MRGISRRTFMAGTGALAVGVRARAQSERVVRVGMILPISGNLAQYAANMFPPFRYVVDKINAEGGIRSMGGARIELVVADNASGSAGTASEARRLIAQEKVSFIAGPLVTGEMLALVPVLEEFKVPALSFTSGDSRSKYLFSIGLTYEKGYAAPPIDFLTYLVKEKQRNIRSVALVYSNYEAGQQIANFQEKMVTAAGLAVVARVPVDRTAQDQTSTILRIKSAKPDAVAGLVLTREGVLLQQARANLRYNETTFVGCGAGYADVTLWNELGPKLAGQVLTRNLFATNGFVAGIELPGAKQIVSELQGEIDAKKIQGPIGHYQVWGAQAARLTQAAFELAGSDDREALRSAFAKVRIERGDPFLYLPRRELAFGEDNCLTDQTALALQWQPDGSQQVLWPGEFSHAEPRPYQ